MNRPHERPVRRDAERSIPDHADALRLDGGYLLAWCVGPDGSRQPWVISPAGDAAEHGCSCSECCPHEQFGPMPTSILRRAHSYPFRCGRPRSDGKPCRMIVRRAGDACDWHGEHEADR